MHSSFTEVELIPWIVVARSLIGGGFKIAFGKKSVALRDTHAALKTRLKQ
jgi:hypothetical protein